MMTTSPASRNGRTSPGPAAAYDDLLARVLPQSREQRVWSPSDGPLPSLFVSHGAPFTLDDPQWVGDLFAWAQSMPKPRAIVVISAHWEHAPTAITAAAAGTPLYYDFSGFHPRYKTLPYATPDASDLARRLTGLLGSTPVHQFADRGLDHGAFFAVFHQPALAGQTAAFDEWAIDALARGDVDALTDYRRKAPGAAVAHPSAEHFVPLLLTVGAADDPASAVSAIDRMVMGNSIRSVQLT
ncbi:dioxygenase [Nocardia sp. KC 131]|uniref:dioxygenase family protein n=1 Tax=Nocardia arseniciresistens TaxID=3392119 RepID=UPI00398EE85D